MPVESRAQVIELGKSSLATYSTARDKGKLIEVQVPHWRDQLIVSRGAAIISYSGLMIAASIVYLSGAKSGSVLAPPYYFGACVTAASVSLVCFLGSAFLSLFTIVRGFGAREFPEGSVWDEDSLWYRLGRIALYHRWQRKLQKMSLRVTIAGTAILAFALLASLGGNLVHWLSAS